MMAGQTFCYSLVHVAYYRKLRQVNDEMGDRNRVRLDQILVSFSFLSELIIV